jgi:hypothetical protein
MTSVASPGRRTGRSDRDSLTARSAAPFRLARRVSGAQELDAPSGPVARPIVVERRVATEPIAREGHRDAGASA